MSKQTETVIEFFHDAVCGWCYVLSPRLRKIAKQEGVKIVQRCFVLQRNDEEMVARFGSLQQAKSEILNHWVSCKQVADDPSTIDIDGMRAKPFKYPSGYLAALGAKAAEILGTTDTHWDYFDEIQRLHLKVNDNIGAEETIIQAAINIGLDAAQFRQQLRSEATVAAVEKDLLLARHYDIRSIPTIVINGERVISKALTQAELAQLFLN